MLAPSLTARTHDHEVDGSRTGAARPVTACAELESRNSSATESSCQTKVSAAHSMLGRTQLLLILLLTLLLGLLLPLRFAKRLQLR